MSAIQHFRWDYGWAALGCGGCPELFTDNTLNHRDNCPEWAALAAAAVEAERAKLATLRAAVQRVLSDEESRPGGWGPDVTALRWLREALEASA